MPSTQSICESCGRRPEPGADEIGWVTEPNEGLEIRPECAAALSPPEQSNTLDLTEALQMAEAKLSDALWRERVAEVALRELHLVGGSEAEVRYEYRENLDWVLDLYDGERVITARDVFYVLERCRS